MVCKIPQTEANFLRGASQIHRTVIKNFIKTMTNSKLIKSIKHIISQNIGLGSESQMLAFFGFTSKSESHYRDVIAYKLYKEYKDEFLITREWNKCDIAILDKETGKAVLLLELKVCYNVDLIKSSTLKEYIDSIKKDFEKSKKISEPKTEIYSIMFIVKPEQIIPEELKKIVKYSDAINAGLKKLDYKDLDKIGEANLRNEFKKIEFHHIRKDIAFDLTCGLGYCLIEE